MRHAALAATLLLCAPACGDDPEPDPGAFGASCATVSDTSTECDSMVCTDAFDQEPTPICSIKCTTPDTCPEGSSGKKCNMKGFCKP
ncbi:MAG: hypothetical protein KIT31_22015 [Deltaproteobacteria bacterium]|nr:hypothetical protein [Deltaproteobacteria bacterium]